MDLNNIKNALVKFGNKGFDEEQKPLLVVISANADEETNAKIGEILTSCDKLHVSLVVYKNEYTLAELKDVLYVLAIDEEVTGIILLPLVGDLKAHERELLDMIPWYKDVMGTSTDSVGRFWTNQTGIKKPMDVVMCAIATAIEDGLSGKKITMVVKTIQDVNSASKLLLDKGASVAVLHEKSDMYDISNVFATSDIVISNVKAEMLLPWFDKKDRTTWIYFGDDLDIESDSVVVVPKKGEALSTLCAVLNVKKAHECQKKGVKK